jgi:hypothetical protein
MKDMTYLQGVEELEKLKKYAAASLNEEEMSSVQIMDEKVKAYINGSDEFLTIDEVVELSCIWRRYQHLKPFVFLFDPKKTMPEVVQNRAAFIIWTVWRAFHLLGEEDLKGAVLAAANTLSKFQPPYSSEAKEKAVREFAVVMTNTGCRTNDLSISLSFWEGNIFPYLEEKWEFIWE